MTYGLRHPVVMLLFRPAPSPNSNTVKPVKRPLKNGQNNGLLKITNGSSIKVESIAECPLGILLICIKR